jgi:hypothetical protein
MNDGRASRRHPGDRHRGQPPERHARPTPHLRVGAPGRGESIKALAAYLGHSDPGFTLRTYTHLLPTGEDRTRRAIDRAFGDDDRADGPDADDGLATA